MIIIITSFILGYLFTISSAPLGIIPMVLIGAIGFFSPSFYILEKIYKAQKKNLESQNEQSTQKNL